MNLDFSSVDSQELLDEGTYLATITKYEKKESSTKKEMYLVTLKEAETGSALWENFVISEATLWKLKEFLSALGYDVPKGEFEFDWEEIVGQQVNIKVIQEEYNGDMKNRIKKFLPA